MENWKPVVDYEDSYEVSDLGRVRSVRKSLRNPNPPLILAPVMGHGKYKDYPKIGLWRNGRAIARSVHRLVARAFLGEPPKEMERPTVNHKDNDHKNNRLDNLEWLSQADNVRAYHAKTQPDCHTHHDDQR